MLYSIRKFKTRTGLVACRNLINVHESIATTVVFEKSAQYVCPPSRTNHLSLSPQQCRSGHENQYFSFLVYVNCFITSKNKQNTK